MSTSNRAGLTKAFAVVAALLATFLWIAMLSGPLRLATGLLDARTHLKKAQKALSAGQLKAARSETLEGVAAAEQARSGLDSNSPLYDLGESLPKIGPALEEMPHLVEAIELSADAAKGTLDIAQNALRGPDKIIVKENPEDPKSGSQIRLDRISEIAELVTSIRKDIVGVETALKEVDPQNLPRRVRPDIANAIENAAETDDLLADAEAGFEILPSFLGADGPRTYLIGMQNSAEERGTGGAILQFALVSIAGGKPNFIKNSSTIYDVDKDRQQIDIPLPDDAWYVANIPDSQRFGNSNWSPDWPLSAKLMIDYARATEQKIPQIDLPDNFDGVIAVDPNVMQKLMPGVGPFKTEFGNRISTRKVVHFVLYKAYASFPIPKIRRARLRAVVDEFYDRMLRPAHPAELVQGLGDSLSQKHMQVWLADPAEQAFIERMDWDGALRKAKGADFIEVVEQNVGGNKLDYFVEQSQEVDIALDGGDSHVTHRTIVDNEVFMPQPRWSMGDSGPLHRPMLNLYVPGSAHLDGAEVEEGERNDLAAEGLSSWASGGPPEHFEEGKKVWSATVDIQPGDRGVVRYDYTVPGVVHTRGGRSTYRLVLQHQPRVRPEAMTIRLQLPEGATDVRAPGWKKDGAELVWQRSLNEDKILEVSWRS